MDFLDGMRVFAAIEDTKEQVAALNDLSVGGLGSVKIPGAKKLAALLVKGKKGRRVRITGVTYEVEA